MSNFAAVYVTRMGKEIRLPVVRSHNQFLLELPQGTLVDFADEIQDSIHGPATWVETIPPDPTLRPRSTSRVRNLQEMKL